MNRRTGRRPGRSTAKDDVLDAARELFAEQGYAGTSLRTIAAKAGVDVALIPYYFGNKRGLFIAATDLPVNPVEKIRGAIVGPRESVARRLLTSFLDTWESPETGPALQTMLRAAVSDDTAGALVGEFSSSITMPVIIEELGISTETAQAVNAMLFGLLLMRGIIEAPAFIAASREATIEAYSVRVQLLIDADPQFTGGTDTRPSSPR